MYKTAKSSFLLKDVKEIFRPRNDADKTDVKKEFVKQCYANGSVPNASLVVHDQFRKDLYALINTVVTPEQSVALGKTFRLLGREAVSELCFSNNNLHDQQFADMLTEIISDKQVADNLQKITYGKNNELGPKTLDVFMKLVAEKSRETPLTQLALVGCKSRLSTISPLLTMLNTVENQL